MEPYAPIVRELQNRVKEAVQTKIPEPYHHDARALFPNLGNVIQSAVAHYRPKTAEALLGQLQGNNTPSVKLLVELLTEKNPLFFLSEVERNLIMRKKLMARRRNERRTAITRAFEKEVKRVAGKIKDVPASHRSLRLLEFLIAGIGAQDLEPLREVEGTPFWKTSPNRQALKQEIDQHIYYFVVLLLDNLRSYDLPEEFKVKSEHGEMLRLAAIFALQEVFLTTMDRIKAGNFVLRQSHYGNRGDRSMDSQMFLNPKRRKGISAFFGDIKEIYRKDS